MCVRECHKKRREEDGGGKRERGKATIINDSSPLSLTHLSILHPI